MPQHLSTIFRPTGNADPYLIGYSRQFHKIVRGLSGYIYSAVHKMTLCIRDVQDSEFNHVPVFPWVIYPRQIHIPGVQKNVHGPSVYTQARIKDHLCWTFHWVCLSDLVYVLET